MVSNGSLDGLPDVPTKFLPPLNKIRDYSLTRIISALNSLRDIYWPTALPIHARTISIPLQQLPPKLGLSKGSKVNRPANGKTLPDSGYATEEEGDDDDDDDVKNDIVIPSTNTGDDIDILRADHFERTFAIKWLTGFVSRSDTWISSSSDQNDEDERYQIMDEITSLLSAFAVDNQAEEALTRHFSFRLAGIDMEQALNVELNDAPISNEDHTSVGLQSWASSIVLAERMCAAPVEFGFGSARRGDETRRILELGAGTGLLSIVAAKLLCRTQCNTKTEIVATDYHPDVLSNLTSNIQTNFLSARSPIKVHLLDWEHPFYTAPLDLPFELMLAADVIYQPEHARWIKGCVEKLLLRPQPHCRKEGGIFWLIVALRSTGRHEGLSDTVDEIFPDAALRIRTKQDECEEWALAVLGREEFGKREGVGRADESGFKLFKIGWVRC